MVDLADTYEYDVNMTWAMLSTPDPNSLLFKAAVPKPVAVTIPGHLNNRLLRRDDVQHYHCPLLLLTLLLPYNATQRLL